MNFDNIIFSILGTICFGVVLWTGFYFQPIIHHNDIHKTYLLKSTTDSLISPDSFARNSRVKHTYACLDTSEFILVNDSWVFTENGTRGIQLTDIPVTITKQRNGYYLGHTKPLIENQIIVLDKNKNIITSTFIDELTKLSNQYPRSKSEYDFYKNACITVRYMNYNQQYYIHPINTGAGNEQ